ncbi:MAG TPA: flagellar basal body L-ring protein FlgH [Steroidobacteraceae bacterium]|nr:flagellar basal body L-ring protein FlgH [Steroidobacteraceae bacterium]
MNKPKKLRFENRDWRLDPNESRISSPESRLGRLLSITFCLQGAAVLLSGALLSGCISMPQPENFDATWPEVVEPAAATSGAIYHADHDASLFENSTARRVGDTVTIQLVEATNASKSSTTTTKKETGVDIGAPTGIGSRVTAHGVPIGVGLDNKNSFTGQGDTSQSNKLQGQITVTVAKRLPNGNLLVRGQKWLALNQGSEFVRVQGIIRPIDIDNSNSVPSYKVADAQISYGGQGSLADANAPGLLSRFFNSKWMPF